MENSKVTMTIPEGAQRLGISRNAAYAAARTGQLPTIRIGNRILIPLAAFERMLENAGNTVSTEAR
jgi:excisionase family DNA binding protein